VYGSDGLPIGRVTNDLSLAQSGVIDQRLVNPNGTIDPAVSSTLDRLGYSVSPDGVISPRLADNLPQDSVIRPLEVDPHGRVIITGSVPPRMSAHAADGLTSSGVDRGDMAAVLAGERLRGVREDMGEGVGGIGHTGGETDFDRHLGRAGTVHDSGVALDHQGLPEFDSVHDSIIPDVMRGPGTDDDTQFMMATAELRQAIARDPALAARFNDRQLAAIEAVEPRIPGYIWHHHQDGRRLQLVDSAEHARVGHWGGRAEQGGRPRPNRTMP